MVYQPATNDDAFACKNELFGYPSGEAPVDFHGAKASPPVIQGEGIPADRPDPGGRPSG